MERSMATPWGAISEPPMSHCARREEKPCRLFSKQGSTPCRTYKELAGNAAYQARIDSNSTLPFQGGLSGAVRQGFHKVLADLKRKAVRRAILVDMEERLWVSWQAAYWEVVWRIEEREDKWFRNIGIAGKNSLCYCRKTVTQAVLDPCGIKE